MSEWIDREKAIEDLQNGDPSQLYDVEDIKYWLNCLPLAQPEGRSGVFIPDITVKNLRKAPLEAVGELLMVGEMEDIVLSSAQSETNCSEFPNNSDAISRQAAIEAIHEDADWLAAQGSDWQVERMERDKSILKSLPSAEPERKKGKWLRSGNCIFPYECDQCGDTNERDTTFCPNCGADMREREDTDE